MDRARVCAADQSGEKTGSPASSRRVAKYTVVSRVQMSRRLTEIAVGAVADAPLSVEWDEPQDVPLDVPERGR